MWGGLDSPADRNTCKVVEVRVDGVRVLASDAVNEQG
jgi:hypothetical protein